MNNNELDQLLKSARVPERPAAHWENVPKQILAKLHWQDHATTAATPHRFSISRWGLALTSACVVGLLTFALWPHRNTDGHDSAGSFGGAEKCYREIQEMFPNQIRAIVLSDHDSRIDLAKTANLPDDQPIAIVVCGPDGCRTIITFSGQRIRADGDEWEVLASGKNGVIVAGNTAVWTSDEPTARLSHFRIEAKQIKSS